MLWRLFAEENLHRNNYYSMFNVCRRRKGNNCTFQLFMTEDAWTDWNYSLQLTQQQKQVSVGVVENQQAARQPRNHTLRIYTVHKHRSMIETVELAHPGTPFKYFISPHSSYETKRASYLQYSLAINDRLPDLAIKHTNLQFVTYE